MCKNYHLCVVCQDDLSGKEASAINEKLKEKIKESVASVLPITLIVLAISITLVPLEVGTLTLFLGGAVLLIVGMGLFQLGAEISMTPIGQGIGNYLVKKSKLVTIIIVCFVMGFIITMAEPDLQVLANQVASIPNDVLIWTVALGVGVFLGIAFLRIYFKVDLAKLLFIFYIGLFILAFLAPSEFTAVAFDSGGVTTGPMTVPFIMAFGVGLSSARSDKESAADSFGLVALCSVGPILMVLLLSILYNPSDAIYEAVTVPDIVTTTDVIVQFIEALPEYASEVMTCMLPIIGALLLFQVLTRTYRPRQLLRMGIGIVYTICGLILFLVGVNVGFAPVGNLIGSGLGDIKWVLVPIGMLIGYYIVKAEPAVQVLNDQVEELTGGMISHKMMNIALSVGVAGALGIAMARMILGINILWIIIPGYALALIMTKFVPEVFIGIAFDSGGVASGPMTSTFLLPLAMGACVSIGGNVVTDAFGVVAMVALAPLIAIQVMGIVYDIRAKRASTDDGLVDDTLIDFEEDFDE